MTHNNKLLNFNFGQLLCRFKMWGAVLILLQIADKNIFMCAKKYCKLITLMQQYSVFSIQYSVFSIQ